MHKKYIPIIISLLTVLLIVCFWLLLMNYSLNGHPGSTGAADLERVIAAPLLALAVGMGVFIKRNYLHQVKA